MRYRKLNDTQWANEMVQQVTVHDGQAWWPELLSYRTELTLSTRLLSDLHMEAMAWKWLWDLSRSFGFGGLRVASTVLPWSPTVTKTLVHMWLGTLLAGAVLWSRGKWRWSETSQSFQPLNFPITWAVILRKKLTISSDQNKVFIRGMAAAVSSRQPRLHRVH